MHPHLIQLFEVIDYDEGDKMYMSKSCLANALVMDYAEKGEILKWNSKTCRFRPYRDDVEYLSEQEIKRFLRHCIRGLHYSKILHFDMNQCTLTTSCTEILNLKTS